MTQRNRMLRGAAALIMALAVLLTAFGGAEAATSYTVGLGSHGTVRWTVGQSVYVNLKAMTAGTWKQQLWAGTCASPTSRLAVLQRQPPSRNGSRAKPEPGLVEKASGPPLDYGTVSSG